MRTHCDCGKLLPPIPILGDWGVWCCRCGLGYCQDCGERLDENDECTAYHMTKE